MLVFVRKKLWMNFDGNDIINIFQSIQEVKRDPIDQRYFKGAYENLLEQLYHTCIRAVNGPIKGNTAWVSIHFSSIQLLLVQASLKTYRQKLHFELCDIQTNGRACDGLADNVLSVYSTLKKVDEFIKQKDNLGLGVEQLSLLR